MVRTVELTSGHIQLMIQLCNEKLEKLQKVTMTGDLGTVKRLLSNMTAKYDSVEALRDYLEEVIAHDRQQQSSDEG